MTRVIRLSAASVTILNQSLVNALDDGYTVQIMISHHFSKAVVGAIGAYNSKKGGMWSTLKAIKDATAIAQWSVCPEN